MRNSLTGIALVGLLIVVPAVVSAQQTPARRDTGKEPTTSSKMARAEEKFMKDAAAGGMAEVKFGEGDRKSVV